MTGRRVVRGDVELATDHESWRFRAVSPELVVCEREHRLDNERRLVTDVSGPFWLLALATVTSGRLAFLHGPRTVTPPGARYALFLPPGSLIQSEFFALHQRAEILISDHPLPPACPREPVLFPPPSGPLPTSVTAALGLLGGLSSLTPISRCPQPSSVSRRAKAALDAGFPGHQPLAVLATELGVAHASMTRGFKREFGLTPARYRTAVRVMTAAMTLLHGEEIAEVAFRVGFGDLGRFYKQFRSATGATPARYQIR